VTQLDQRGERLRLADARRDVHPFDPHVEQARERGGRVGGTFGGRGVNDDVERGHPRRNEGGGAVPHF
jgi:hypothetical protein